MRDIWNPWHGCKKKSEGCRHCYMFYLDKMRNADGSKIYRVKNNFDYPLQRDLHGSYKVKSGEQLRVCLTSDFFLEEADPWRDEAWEIMHERPDVAFLLLTKRPERVASCLPQNWNDGWENVLLSVSAENQVRADERLEILATLPFKHKGVVAAPFIGPVSLEKYLAEGFIKKAP
ncbi:MAG: phage Gp37/Gp68 family protein [Succinatimonas sp.]|nr:phage Gp37/Gp68 family protein [Succinatimonas sp.]